MLAQNILVEWDQVQNLSFASVARLLAVEKDELVLMQGQEGVALMVVLDGWLERRESLESTEVIERYGIGACIGGRCAHTPFPVSTLSTGGRRHGRRGVRGCALVCAHVALCWLAT